MRIGSVQVGRLVAKSSYWIMLLLFYMLAASQAVQSFSYKWTTIANHEQYSLQKILDHELPKPYVYRPLMPYVIDFIVTNSAADFPSILRMRSQKTLEAVLGDKNRLMTTKLVDAYAVIILFDFIFLVATLFVLRAMSRFVFIPLNRTGGSFLSDISPILYALMLSLSYRAHNGFIYDHLEMLCLTLYIILTMYRKWLMSVLVLVIAILNKETAVLFPLLGAVTFLANSDNRINSTLVIKLISESCVVFAGSCLFGFYLEIQRAGALNFMPSGTLIFGFLSRHGLPLQLHTWQ